MWLHKNSMCRFLLARLLIVGLTLSKALKASEEIRETKVTFEETSSTSDQSVRETTTPASLLRPDSDRELTSPTVVEGRSRNNSNVFKPSKHLGEIERPAVRTSPFNNVHHVRFENNVHLDSQHERFHNVLQDASQGSGLLDEATRSSRIKFQDDGAVQTSNIRHSFDDRLTVTESPRAQFEEGPVGHTFVDQTFFQNVEKPEMQEIFGKTTTDHRSTGIYYDASRSPYVVNYYAEQNQNAYQPTSPQETAIEMMKRPEGNGVMVLQQHESTYTRKRKFPYSFYQPAGEYHEVQYMEDPHQTIAHPRVRRPFPWKKIIHLIGTILPLGLLLASLKPNVVRIDNSTTQPNIVLSKLRLADLPVEHKQTRVLDDPSVGCENQSVCELILAGGEPQSNILQNILWNLATRTPDDVAKRNGLREVFSAVRKKDCTTISC
ncbi:PREDICTED: uncharacterized protein LOC105570251 [Vollenhovia emeryi]|uniref:uncharacterized protein LOC105570251 n=1 Tax=Vollenhovia emeryi TaxID=411798 RepID=UPI0005F505DD|nr:PREDICTED: uncharacterized protein LOC105570251 [Vollenhovia emeryi]XP_011882717.1 PREDICTED: uncharacterized protein LOC105570251 [Vollenhovia emeryi]